MDFRHVLSDEDLRAELVARLPELVERATLVPSATAGGFEGLEGGVATAVLEQDIEQLAEGAGGGDGTNPGLEAIIERFTRPVLLVQDSSYAPAVDGFVESEHVTGLLSEAKARLDTAIPSVGRIDLRNHRKDWVGTGWMIASDIAVTNRHVADEFATTSGTGFGFRLAMGDRAVKASVDWRREFQRADEAIVRVTEVIWMEPDGSHDVALLRIDAEDDSGGPPPAVLSLMSQAEIDDAVDQWVAVIGYPAQSPYNDAADQQRIFDGIYGVKRLAPGTVMSVSPDGLFHHDATTLGGNSGSVVIHLTSGKVVGLHFGGFEGDRNMAVQAPVLSSLVAEHA